MESAHNDTPPPDHEDEDASEEPSRRTFFLLALAATAVATVAQTFGIRSLTSSLTRKGKVFIKRTVAPENKGLPHNPVQDAGSEERSVAGNEPGIADDTASHNPLPSEEWEDNGGSSHANKSFARMVLCFWVPLRMLLTVSLTAVTLFLAGAEVPSAEAVFVFLFWDYLSLPFVTLFLVRHLPTGASVREIQGMHAFLFAAGPACVLLPLCFVVAVFLVP